MFIGRSRELENLNQLYASDRFEFAVIYGRKRVGKSTMIQKFCESKNFIYYVGSPGGKKDNIQGLSSMIFQHSFMENQVLGYKSPLYGRRTSQFKIEPFHFYELKEFGWKYSPQEMAVIYAITGGVAEYLTFIDASKSVKDNIIQLYLNPNGRMYEEPINLLKQELRDPRMYHSVLNSIVSGNATLNDIATKAGELPTSTSFHLRSLMELGIVKKETPIGEKETTKKSIYSIADSSFVFWYTSVYGNQAIISFNAGEFLYQKLVEPTLTTYMGHIFESICQTYMIEPSVFEHAPFFYTTVGRWWDSHPKKKSQEEIDVCAMDKKHVLLGECKWTKDPIDQKVLHDLLAQGDLFSQKEQYFYLYSKNGFTDAVLNEALHDTRISLITIEDIYLNRYPYSR